jgi:hypothetical protein
VKASRGIESRTGTRTSFRIHRRSYAQLAYHQQRRRRWQRARPDESLASDRQARERHLSLH